jgi:hypothetical protein
MQKPIWVGKINKKIMQLDAVLAGKFFAQFLCPRFNLGQVKVIVNCFAEHFGPSSKSFSGYRFNFNILGK